MSTRDPLVAFGATDWPAGDASARLIVLARSFPSLAARDISSIDDVARAESDE